MINVLLSVYGTGNKSSIKQTYTLTLKNSTTVRELLEELEGKMLLPKRFGNTINYQDLLVLVDRQNVFNTEGLGLVLRDGARVVILQAIAGG